MWEEAAETLDGVESSGTQPGTSRFTVGESHGAALERADAASGDGDFDDRGGEGC
jgi:hypothetical protein